MKNLNPEPQYQPKKYGMSMVTMNPPKIKLLRFIIKLRIKDFLSEINCLFTAYTKYVSNIKAKSSPNKIAR